MATRSAIGYRKPDGSICAVYCHWDGYPEHQLPILTERYDSLRKVQALIRPGSMSSLQTEQLWDSDYVIDPDTGRGHYEPSRPARPLYHHERGEGPWSAPGSPYAIPPITSSEIEAADTWRGYDCEHLYVFCPEDGWQHRAL